MNLHPLKGPAPDRVPFNHNAEAILLKGLVHARQRSNAGVIKEVDQQYNFSVGQIKFMQENQIVVVMRDDLGKYELGLGPENKIIKRRL